jgi:hypothetical protein
VLSAILNGGVILEERKKISEVGMATGGISVVGIVGALFVTPVWAVSSTWLGGLTPVFQDPVLLLELLSVLMVAYCLSRKIRTESALEWRHEGADEGVVRTGVGVGALISEPKRSLSRQC